MLPWEEEEEGVQPNKKRRDFSCSDAYSDPQKVKKTSDGNKQEEDEEEED